MAGIRRCCWESCRYALCRVLAVLLTWLQQQMGAYFDLGRFCSSGKPAHVSTSCAAGFSAEWALSVRSGRPCDHSSAAPLLRCRVIDCRPMQFALLAFLLGHSLEAFGQWKALLHLLLSCEEAPVHTATGFYAEALGALHAQLSHCLANSR